MSFGYMSGAKAARNAGSIVNRPTCGGPKKGGLTPRIGNFLSSNPNMMGATNTMYGMFCVPNTTTQTQAYGYKATHGGNR
jgi:hypothetical protein